MMIGSHISTFAIRSTYPNMIEERVMPCITHVRTLLNSELGLSCSIGVTYGKAFCGLVSKGRSEYTVLGPAVNLAARMMSHFLNPGIMVDEVTKEKAGNRPFTSVCPIRAKGYTNYVNIYIPEDNVQRLDWNECPCIVGHDQDVASIIRRAETVLEKNSGSEFVFVEGPYGIGKSTLLSYTAQKIQDMCNTRSRDAIIFRRVCSDEDSFHVFR